MIQVFSLINMLNCLPPLLALVCPQAGTYKINYVYTDEQFFIITTRSSIEHLVGRQANGLTLNIPAFQGLLRVNSKTEKMHKVDKLKIMKYKF